MQTLGLQLDTQAASVLDAVERQSRMVIDASDLAQTQLREAEAALAARAADLAAAAGEAQDAARIAADDLARQTLRLENVDRAAVGRPGRRRRPGSDLDQFDRRPQGAG